MPYAYIYADSPALALIYGDLAKKPADGARHRRLFVGGHCLTIMIAGPSGAGSLDRVSNILVFE